jgi:BirA family transcriptional regulator, biotin operon repressor / biotin---[acetyl-CoA-carboxylase] ligase
MDRKLNKNLIKMAGILSDGEYHDGTTLGGQLNMTRSAVWKMIKKLENNDIKIHSLKGKGYALPHPLILLDANKIKKNILSNGIHLEVFESISSTNDYLKKSKHTNTIKICLAEQQTQGKGRFNRKWVSPFGKNVYMSCLYPFKKDISELSGLSMAVSLAIVKVLKQIAAINDLFVKWPNDIVHDNKKLAGCLVEIQAETHGACQVVIGIGVNVNMLHDNEISQPWTSLQKMTQTYFDRNELCAALINYLLDYLQTFESKGLAFFIDEWKAADCLTEKKVALKTMNEPVYGKAVGINEQGQLLLKLQDGKIKAFSSGETSILKK